MQNAKISIDGKIQKGENTIHANSIFSNQIISPSQKAIVANSNVTSTNMINRSSNQIIK